MPLLDTTIATFPLWEEIQSTGMPASKPYFSKLYPNFTDRMVTLSTTLSMAYFGGEYINPNSSLDTAKLCDLYNLKPTKKTPNGRDWSYAKGSIEHLRYQHSAFSLLFDWREIAHFRDSFVTPILASMNPRTLYNDGLETTYDIVGSLQITRTTSRRPSMKKSKERGINLFNLPSRQRSGMSEGLSKSIRSGFIAPDNQLLAAADLSQIELRILASVSSDDVLCDIFHKGQDPHTQMAMKMYNIDKEEDVDPVKHRKSAKAVNFMIANGGGGKKMYEMYQQEGVSAGRSIDSCDKDIETWYNICWGVAEWKDRFIYNVRKKGYAETVLGMRRYLPDIWSHKASLRNAAEREGINHYIQGSAQDLIHASMCYVYEQLRTLRDVGYKVRCALQLYDELIFRFDRRQHEEEDLGGLIMDMVVDALTNHAGISLNVPILADGNIGSNWGEL